jgi:glycosyltransferase involved in cell wall biosynthesis
MMKQPFEGVGRYTKGLVSSLLLVDQENKYFLIQDKFTIDFFKESDRIKIVKVPYPALSIRTLFFLHKVIEKEKIDVFHSPFSLGPLFSKRPFIITFHDLMVLKFPNFFEGRNLLIKVFAKLFFSIVVPITSNKCRMILTDSNKVKNEIITFLKQDPDKIKVSNPGVDEYFKKLTSKSLNGKLPELKPNKKTILYVGNTRPYKNLPRLLEAFGLLQKKRPENYQLVIAGGEKRNLPLLKKITLDLSIEKNIIFAGNLTDPEVVALMNAADVFVFPSLEEGFGLPPLEAMACGTPVVTSNVSSLPEVVRDAALLVDPENVEGIAFAIERVLTDEKLREELIKKGFERVKRFSWEKTARETLEIYKSVAEIKNKGD